MKQKDFYYSTLYVYDKTLVDALKKDFTESGSRNKTAYLADLIALGLTINNSAPNFPIATRSRIFTANSPQLKSD